MKNKNKKIFSAALLIAGFTFIGFCGCDQLPSTVSSKIFPIVIEQGALLGNGQEGFPNKQFAVIKTAEEWENLKTQLNSVNNVTDNFTETNIDFSLYQVIFVIDEIKGNGGWSIDVTDITEYSDSIVVTVSNLKTGNVSDVITQPFEVVKIPVTYKPIIFNDLTVSNPDPEGEQIVPDVIGRYFFLGRGHEYFPNKQFSVIKTEEEWINLKTLIDSVGYPASNKPTVTDIDFSSYMVIFVVDDMKPFYYIEITNITEYLDKIVVTVSNLETGSIIDTSMQTCEIVKIPVSSKPIIFNDLTVSNNEN